MTFDRIGKVQVLAALGAGAHSSIVKVRRLEDSREYALKIIPVDGDADRKFLDQAKHEFRVSRLLNHPNLVKVHAFETESDWRFRVKKAKLLIELVPGQTLDSVPLVPMPRLLRIFGKVASGLVHMHKQGVFHADLKPNNLMLGRGTNVKVLDYGLAWIQGEPKDRVQGTPEYMAPETAAHKQVTERTDIYNFGATMYRLVTLKLPPCAVPQVGGHPVDEVHFRQQLTPADAINKTTPKPLAALIGRCLSWNAHQRPLRMSEVQGELDRLADDAGYEEE